MSSFWSRNISLSIFGESHGPAIGIVIDNLPPGEYIDVENCGSSCTPCAEKGRHDHATW